LVNTFQKALHLVNGFPGIRRINGVISEKHFPYGMPRYFHDHRFRDPGLSHVCIETMAGVMENKSAFCSSSVWYLGITANPR